MELLKSPFLNDPSALVALAFETEYPGKAAHIPAGAVPEILAHELAHVVTPGDNHGPEWKAAFERIYSKYNELALARFGNQETEAPA